MIYKFLLVGDCKTNLQGAARKFSVYILPSLLTVLAHYGWGFWTKKRKAEAGNPGFGIYFQSQIRSAFYMEEVNFKEFPAEMVSVLFRTEGQGKICL